MPTTTIETPLGPGRLHVAAPAAARALLLLGHGAGGGVDSFDLEALARVLPDRDIAVARFEQPWRVAGRRVAGPPASLDRAWAAALAWAAATHAGLPLIVGGRSAGARVACRSAAAPARGVVCLSFPLHPPGKPAASRIGELAGAGIPALVIQGERDPFGSPDEVRAALAAAGIPPASAGAAPEGVAVLGVPGTHSFTPRTKAALAAADELAALIVDPVAAFVAALS